MVGYHSVMEERIIRVPVSEMPTVDQMRQIRDCFDTVPMKDLLAGLRFAQSRWQAKSAGVLKVGRKSIVRREIQSVTAEQARWRLDNWKTMVASYRRYGYSYPTISRIKKAYLGIAEGA